MPFTEFPRHLALIGLTLWLAACSTSPETTDDASDKVAKKANAALFSGSLFGGKADTDEDNDAEEDNEEADDSDKTAGEGSDQANPAKKSETLPLVLAPGAEKDAKAARSQYAQAMTALKAGNEDQALVLLRDISNRYPNLSGPLLNQAILLRKKGRLTEAEDLLKKSMTSPTQNPRIMNELGVVSRELGNFKQAKAAYESAIRLAPGYDRAHYNLAVLADLYLNDTALAIKEFEMYQSLQDTRDKKVDGWLKELKRRAGAQ